MYPLLLIIYAVVAAVSALEYIISFIIRFLSFFLIYFGPVSVSPYHAHNWVVELQYQNRGHWDTRLYPYNVFNALCYIPCLFSLIVASYRSSSSTSIPFPPYASTTDIALATDSSSHYRSHHILSTQDHGLHTLLFQKYRIVRVAMYCVTELRLFNK